MNKRIFFLITLLILIINCSGFEFVYNDTIIMNEKIKEKVQFSISGDNKDIIKRYFISKIGEVGNDPDYTLSIIANSLIKAEVIETDATASKFMIKHDLKYVLTNIENKCIAFEKNILTRNSYDAKSAGYSFGTDIAEREFSKQNLHSNIDQFLNQLSTDSSNLKC